MSFGLQFNATQVAPNIAPEPVPSGQYVVKIIASEEKPTSGKPGCTYYMFTFEIQEGEFKGRRVFTNLNCKHDMEQTRNIAYATLSSICYVTGAMQINNSQELHDRPFRINVIKEPRNDKPEIMRNNVTGYYNLDGSEPGKTKATAPTNGAPAFATGPANGSFPATAPTLAPITTPAPIQQHQPALQPIVTQPLQPIASPAPQLTQPAQQFTQPATPMIMQRPDGTLINQHGEPVDQYGQLLPVNNAQPIPAQYQPAAQPAQQQAAPQQQQPASATPPWATA